MKYNYSKLLGRLKERNLTQEKLAKIIGKNNGTINAKFNNKFAFTADEIDCICEVLEIPNNEIGTYFFTK
jgi:transcriptional regulator with XRE-family HTH domain